MFFNGQDAHRKTSVGLVNEAKVTLYDCHGDIVASNVAFSSLISLTSLSFSALQRSISITNSEIYKNDTSNLSKVYCYDEQNMFTTTYRYSNFEATKIILPELLVSRPSRIS